MSLTLEKIKLKHNSSEWFEFRKTGLGGSDAAAVLGLSPYKTNVEVWEEKVGLRVPEDISSSPNVRYGKAAEEPLVKLFALDFPTLKVRVNKNVVYRRGFMFASLDAELTDTETKALGFYEGKTTEIHSAAALEKWDRRIPDYYYTQILHYFVVTGRSFAWCKAQIKQCGLNGETELVTRHYKYQRRELLGDLKYLYVKEKEFWGYVERKERPPLLLPNFGKEIQ